MEKIDELAEEGLNVLKKIFRFIFDMPMNLVVYTILYFLAFVGWLARHLTKRPPDAGAAAAFTGSSNASSVVKSQTVTKRTQRR